MSQYTEFRQRSFKAGIDFSALQYTLVKLDTTQNQVIAPTDNTQALNIGIIQNAPKSGAVANVVLCPSEGTSKVLAYASFAIGAELTCHDTDGRFEGADSGDMVYAIAIEAAGAQNDVVEALMCRYPKA